MIFDSEKSHIYNLAMQRCVDLCRGTDNTITFLDINLDYKGW